MVISVNLLTDEIGFNFIDWLMHGQKKVLSVGGKISLVSKAFPGRTLREFMFVQLPLFAALLALAALLARWQNGFLPDGSAPYPIAGVAIEWWQLVWLGVWTGYLMALIGGAAGLLALPYCVSVLGFSGIHVTPTMLLLTLVNPVGALIGFRNDGLYNRELALLFCGSAVAGGLLGPFIRLLLLSDVRTFGAAVGIMLVVAGLELGKNVLIGVRPTPNKGGVDGQEISTLPSYGGKLRVTYAGTTWSIGVTTIFVIGGAIGTISATLGFGGGFLLVPFLSLFYRMPMRMLVAASIPYVMTLSGAGLFSYDVLLPVLQGAKVQPDWGFGLFVAAGGVLGSRLGAKSQRIAPERPLRLSSPRRPERRGRRVLHLACGLGRP